MKAFLETTIWDMPCPNHTYILSDDKSKMYAYIKLGTKEPFYFKKPIRFDVRGRKFQEVKGIKLAKEEVDPSIRKWTVAGSKGNEYVVTEEEGKRSCSCPGYTFRGKCKHTEEVLA
jgi:hypothetical protein